MFLILHYQSNNSLIKFHEIVMYCVSSDSILSTWRGHNVQRIEQMPKKHVSHFGFIRSTLFVTWAYVITIPKLPNFNVYFLVSSQAHRSYFRPFVLMLNWCRSKICVIYSVEMISQTELVDSEGARPADYIHSVVVCRPTGPGLNVLRNCTVDPTVEQQPLFTVKDCRKP